MTEIEQLRQQTIDSVVRTQDMDRDQVKRLITRIEALEQRVSDLEEQLADHEERHR